MAKGECPNPQPDCKYSPRCYADDHHQAFPKNRYRSKLEQKYRRASTVHICRREHDEIHAAWALLGLIPSKPTPAEMRTYIIRVNKGEL